MSLADEISEMGDEDLIKLYNVNCRYTHEIKVEKELLSRLQERRLLLELAEAIMATPLHPSSTVWGLLDKLKSFKAKKGGGR